MSNTAPFQPAPSQQQWAAPSESLRQQPLAQAAPVSAAPSHAQAPAPAAQASVTAGPVGSLTPQHVKVQAVLEQLISQISANPNTKLPDQRKLAEIRKRLAELWVKLAQPGYLSPTGDGELQILAAAVERGDFSKAKDCQTAIVRSDWANNSSWLTVLKTLLLLAAAQS
jgi:glucose/arabinose dehydrogenase